MPPPKTNKELASLFVEPERELKAGSGEREVFGVGGGGVDVLGDEELER